MRKLILSALLILLYTAVRAQNETTLIHNFMLSNGDIYWQKVYTDIDSITVANYFNNPPFEQKNNTDYSTTVTLKNYSNKGYMNRALILNDESTIIFSLQIKGDKYRVTVSDIIWRSVATIYGISTASTNDLKSYAYNKKGKLKFKEGGIIEKQLDEALCIFFDAARKVSQKEAILDSDF